AARVPDCGTCGRLACSGLQIFRARSREVTCDRRGRTAAAHVHGSAENLIGKARLLVPRSGRGVQFDARLWHCLLAPQPVAGQLWLDVNRDIAVLRLDIARSEERRVGKEWREGWWRHD